MGCKRPEYDLMPVPPAPGFGDSIGGMAIAGGIMGALFHRERTGEGTTVDVSLLGVGLWSMGAALALSLQHNVGWAPPPPHTPFKSGLPSGMRGVTAASPSASAAGVDPDAGGSAFGAAQPAQITTAAR